jgi:hypothetical protein
MSWGQGERRTLLREAAQAVVANMNSDTLFAFAYAAIKATRPDAGLIWSQVAAEIHSVCRGHASECASCPHRLDGRKLDERMLEHVACAEWETNWGVADEMRTHEEIYCRPCPHWGKRRP